MNKTIIKNRFSKASKTYSDNAVAQGKIAKKLALHIAGEKHDGVERILEIGCGSGRLTQELLNIYKPKQFLANDLSSNWEEQIKRIGDIEFISGDAEKTSFDGKFDIIASSSTFQWFSDFELFCSNISKNMHDESLMGFSTFIPGNLMEIKELTGVSLDYLSFEEVKRILSKNYDIVYCDHEEIKLHFDTPYDVLNHLRQTGVTGISHFKWNKQILLDFYKKYNQEYRYRDKVILTYQPAYFLVRLKKQ